MNNCVPDRFKINAVVLVAKPVAETSNIVPGWPRTEGGAVFSETNGCFANERELSFHGGDCARIVPEGLHIHAFGEPGDHRNAVDDVPERKVRFVKRQQRPRVRPAPERVL